MTGGLHANELVILAARPSMGKTALALNMVEHVAVNCQQPTLFVSLEMSKLELGDRLLCSRAKVNGHRLRNGHISKEESQLLIRTANEVSSAPLFIDDNPGRTMTEIAAAARRLKRRHGLSLIVIDYLQLIEPDNSNDPSAGASLEDCAPLEGARPRSGGTRVVLGAAQPAGRVEPRQQAGAKSPA